jgi:hypothetical protein|tara:strand:+ start:367 stop:585 length:219 start_codon:yes stop_codon:yes gene_type:complete
VAGTGRAGKRNRKYGRNRDRKIAMQRYRNEGRMWRNKAKRITKDILRSSNPKETFKKLKPNMKLEVLKWVRV